MRKLIVGMVPLALTAMLLTCGTNQVLAQGGGGGAGGGGAGGGGAGGGGAGGGGSSGTFGSLGGTATTSGNTYSGATGTGGGGSGGSANVQYGSGSPLANYYDNPQSHGLSGNTSATSSQAGNSSSGSGGSSAFGSMSSGGGSSSSSSSNSFANSQAAAAAKFGQALYKVQPVSTFTQPTATSTGTASIRTSNTNNSTQPPTSTNRPTYTTYLGFKPDPVPVGQVTMDVQQAISASPDMSNATNRVQVVVNGDVVVLRGSVQTDRDRELAATLASMTPGVRGVRNELAIRDTSSLGMSSR